jgi:hypothetical protein
MHPKIAIMEKTSSEGVSADPLVRPAGFEPATVGLEGIDR